MATSEMRRISVINMIDAFVCGNERVGATETETETERYAEKKFTLYIMRAMVGLFSYNMIVWLQRLQLRWQKPFDKTVRQNRVAF